uniref:Integrase, catalytic region, zinc finger, CCHC-type, peptidase aspartic, catalytic n=1 Tax=Tanacetum cinerariifolium TaxID=118510 RepID=A0A6L2LHB1_TANCI|nr:hypothetical protein [Tanacetum cinerariifolium]
MMRQNKNLLDINIDALYNILKQNQGDVNDAMKSKKKAAVITSDPLALVAEQTKVSKRKEKVIVSSESERSDDDLKKITTLLAKAFNRKKFYSKPTNNNLRTSSANKKQESVKYDDKKEENKVDEKKKDMSKVKGYNCKKEGHFAKDCKKAKVKDYEYHKIKMLLAKKDKDDQVLLAKDHAWMESRSDSDQEINANMVFMAQMEKVLSDSEESSSSKEETIAESVVDHNNSKETTNLINQLIKEFDKKIAKYHKRLEKANQQSKYFENQNKVLQDKCNVLQNQANIFEVTNNELNEQIKVLIEKNNDLLAQTNVLQDQLKVKHVVIDTHIECQTKYAKLKAERYEYMIRYSAYFDNDKQHSKQFADQEILFDKMSRQLVELDENVRMLQNKVLEKDLKISELEEQTHQSVHMIMPSKDKLYNGRKGIGFENPSYFCKAKDLRPTLYDERVIGLRYTLMFLTHSDEALEIKKFKRATENKIEFAYDYGNLNASYQTTSLKPYVPTVILEKIIIDLKDEVVSLLDKDKENLKIIEPLKSKGCESSENAISESIDQSKNDCQVFEKECDNSENSNVIAPGIFKLNVSQSVSPISVLKTSCASNNVEKKTKRKRRNRNSSKQHDKQVNNDVLHANRAFVHFSDLYTFSSVRRPKLYSRKDLLSCNNFHRADTRSVVMCNNARNASYNARINSYDDANYFFVFDDVCLRKSHVSKMPFRKKPRASLNMHSRSELNKSLPTIMSKWLPKVKSLAEPIAKWIPRIYLWIIDFGCSKHMTGNHSLLTNFVEKFTGTVCFGNNDFVVIVGYRDVVIGSMTIKKVYYVEGLGHNLFSVEQFCDKGLEIAFRKSTCFVRNENGVDLITGDRSSNLYTIALNEIALNSSSCLLAKAPCLQSWLWHQRLSHLNFTTINNLVKKKSCLRCYLLNDYDGVGKLKVKGDIRVFVGYLKESVAFKIYNKCTQKIRESVKVNFDKISEIASKQFSLKLDLSNLNKTRKSLNLTDLQVEETSKKDLEDLFYNFYDEYFDALKIKKLLTPNVETSNTEGEVFHEVCESFQEESSSSSIDDDVQQNAYFDTITTFHDPSDVHTFYQPYPHEKKWTKDHPLYKIIGGQKSSVCTRGQLANSCLFACFLSSIEPANVAEALKDVDWVSAMQDELDQFA